MQLNVSKNTKRLIDSAFAADPQNVTRQTIIPALVMENPNLERIPGQNAVVRDTATGEVWPVVVTSNDTTVKCRRYRNGSYSGILAYSVAESAFSVIPYKDVWLSRNGSTRAPGKGNRRYVHAMARIEAGKRY